MINIYFIKKIVSQYINKINNIILFPLHGNNIYYFTYYVLVLWVTEFFSFTVNESNRIIFILFRGLLFYITIFYIICYLSIGIKKISSLNYKIFHFIIHLIVLLLCIADIFLELVFKINISPSSFDLLLQTNSKEASEFISTYILNTNLILLIISIIISLFIEYYFISKKIIFKYNRIIIESFYSFLIIISLFTSVIKIKNLFNIESIPHLEQTTIGRTILTINALKNTKAIRYACYQSNNNIKIKSCTYQSPKIILCIGESFNRHHSSLYNYKLNTNPLLSKEDNLYVFSNVISPINSTEKCFQYFWSMASIDQDIEWYDKPLIPAIFKKAGYNVIFYSNQFINSINDDYWDYTGSFYFRDKNISDLMFTKWNKKKYKYDLDLINNYKKYKKELEDNSNNFIIFHFMGQHIFPNERYPKQYTYFTKDSINNNNLSSLEKEEVANYDNATRYNDLVVDKIIDLYRNENAIIIYLSDHGDEANDFRSHIGRSSDFSSNNNACAHAQLDIPFMIYVTDKYKSSNSKIVYEIKESINRPFESDDLPHLLLYIAGINTPYYNPKRCLIDKQYNCKRTRLIKKNNNNIYYYK